MQLILYAMYACAAAVFAPRLVNRVCQARNESSPRSSCSRPVFGHAMFPPFFFCPVGVPYTAIGARSWGAARRCPGGAARSCRRGAARSCTQLPCLLTRRGAARSRSQLSLLLTGRGAAGSCTLLIGWWGKGTAARARAWLVCELSCS